MSRVKIRLTLAAAVLLALGAWTAVPRAIDGGRLLAAQDDPARLTDLALDKSFGGSVATREIEAALASDDAELAESFVALADERGVLLERALRDRVAAANDAAASSVRTAGRFVHGFITGEPDDIAGLAGTVTGDLFAFGDLRDVVRETTRAARGEAVDELILGLACVGLAVTAGTYATLGAGAPARVGISVVKAAGRAGRISARMTETLVRPLRGMIDAAALKTAVGPGALLQPALAVRGVRAAVKLEKAQGLVTFVGDVGRLQARAGTRAALDGLRLAETPKDVTRLARLAAAKGNKTRAVLKLLGRGAIMLSVGLFELASTLLWAALYLIGFCAALKRFAERTTLRWIARRKRAKRVRSGERLPSPLVGGGAAQRSCAADEGSGSPQASVHVETPTPHPASRLPARRHPLPQEERVTAPSLALAAVPG